VADRAHEVTPAAGGDVVREPVDLKVGEQFEHRRVRAFQIGPAERRVFGCAQKRVGLRLEFVDGDPGERGEYAAQQRAHVRVIARVVLGEHRA
jgi:hypothetical protein